MAYFDSDAKEMLEVYLLETKQLSQQFGEILTKGEKSRCFTEEELHSIFRIMHTIKSSSAMMGLDALSSMTHKLEDLFAYYREEQGKIEEGEPELFELMYMALDYIEGELEGISGEDYRPGDTGEIEKKTEAYLRKLTGDERDAGEPGADETELPESFTGKNGVYVRVSFEPGCRMENIRAFMLLRQITPLCTEVESYPSNLEKSGESAEYIEKNGVFLRFVSNEREKVLALIRQGLFVSRCEIMTEKKPEVHKPGRSQKNGGENEFLYVKMERLDQLQNIMTELLISTLTLDSDLERRGLTEIREGIFHQVNRLILETEKQVMEMRLVRVSSLVPRLQRLLRDMCRNQKKDVEFVVSCGDIEADKSVVEYMSEALIHVLKNAVDHGIETSADRAASGKRPRGRITFQAENAGGELRITVSDDGRGIDEDEVRLRAREKSLFKKPEEEYSHQEIQELILSPGFTTREQVTEYSGRGVGLDVVKNVLEDAGGHIYIHSEKGKGTTFTILLPLSLTTMECIRFKVGKYRFSLPARHIVRYLEFAGNEENVRMDGERAYILCGEHMVPLVDLRKFYGMEGAAPKNPVLIYLKGMEKEGCILADSMYVQKRIVIKQLPALFGLGFRTNTGICGLSIMGNGKVCAALDFESLLARWEKEGTYGSSF